MKHLSPARKIALSFLIIILLGTCLLKLPVSNINGNSISWIDALFVACSATCVTGLTSVCVYEQFTLFGQIVLMVLIQIGGIGLMTLVATFLLMMKNKLSLHDKIALKELLNQAHIDDFKKFLYGIIKYSFTIELIGALLLLFVFIPEYGLKGIFNALFISVSSFCNAGFDNLTTLSLVPYAHNTYLLIVIMCLILLGGLGFVVWFDIADRIRERKIKKLSLHQLWKSLSVHTKIVLISTFILIFIPAIFFFFLEYKSESVMGDLSLWEKLINALFTSVTLRTAGFASVTMQNMQMSSHLLMLVCMFIGGSPGGTAGGVKTTTVALILICVLRSLRGEKRTNIFNRHISRDIIVRATSIVAINLFVLLTGIFILSMSEDFTFMEICFEATSALATVGLSLGITPSFSVVGKCILILLMYIGRIGIMTFIMSFIKDHSKADIIHYAEGHVIVG